MNIQTFEGSRRIIGGMHSRKSRTESDNCILHGNKLFVVYTYVHLYPKLLRKADFN